MRCLQQAQWALNILYGKYISTSAPHVAHTQKLAQTKSARTSSVFAVVDVVGVNRLWVLTWTHSLRTRWGGRCCADVGSAIPLYSENVRTCVPGHYVLATREGCGQNGRGQIEGVNNNVQPCLFKACSLIKGWPREKEF